MRQQPILWGLVLLFILAGCTAAVIEEATPASPEPTATLHPIFVPGGYETSAEDMFSSLPITTTVPVVSPEPDLIASPTPDQEPEVTPDEVQTPETDTPEPEATRVREIPINLDEVYTQTLEVPVLMYHHIVPPGEMTGDFAVGADSFLEQVNFLASNRYNTIDFYDLSQALKGEAELPDNPIILTFDDGYRDNFEVAFSILNQYAYTGTFFIVTDFVDDSRDGFMDWRMVEQMAALGHRFEPHSRTHADLQDREPDFLISQILDSQEAIAEHIGYTPRFFAYPGGRYDEATMQALQNLDFWGAVTAASGTELSFPGRYNWPRLFIPGDMTLLEFADMIKEGEGIEIGYDVNTSGLNPYPISSSGLSPTATITATTTISIPIYSDNLDPSWVVKTSPGMRFRQQDRNLSYDGNFSISITPQEDFGSLYLQVRPDAHSQYPRDQVLGVSFWLYSEDPLATNDLAIAISGSDDFPYWTATDTSVNLLEYDPIFDDEEAYFLDLNRAIEPETWTRVELLIDDLTYDTNYEYVTGIHLKNNADFGKTVYIDQIQLILSDGPS